MFMDIFVDPWTPHEPDPDRVEEASSRAALRRGTALAVERAKRLLTNSEMTLLEKVEELERLTDVVHRNIRLSRELRSRRSG